TVAPPPTPSPPNAPTARLPRTPRYPRTPPTPPTPPRPVRPARPVSGITDAIAMPAPAGAAQPSRQERMRQILDDLARGSITITEADRRLADLEREA
ncbi:MAG TPA: hypothetical protein VEX37_10305, partial [Thermomicrobiales bacterium]|nr:hypothetical protein [Thermomicrobiales bacterium]